MTLSKYILAVAALMLMLWATGFAAAQAPADALSQGCPDASRQGLHAVLGHPMQGCDLRTRFAQPILEVQHLAMPAL